MKRVFLNRSNALIVPFSLALALTLGLGVQSGSHAAVKSIWNPMHWLSADQTTDNAATEALKKADQAQQAADQAMQDAQKAIEKAAEARRQAEALAKTSQSSKKPVVIDPTETEAQASSDSEKVSQTNVYQAPTHTDGRSEASATSKHEAWNPLNWFHKDPDKETGLEDGIPLEAPVKLTPVPQTETQQPQSTEPATERKAEQTESADTHNRGSWNLKNLFTKPAQPETLQTASTEKHETAVESAQKREASTQQSAETKADKKDETSTTQSKGGWNLLNMLSKPGQADNTQVSPPPSKEADKPTQPDSAETDQSVKTQAALIETERGNIAIELYPDQAPLTVANFVKLVNSGFYNRFNMKFHRVVPGFVVQTGDPTGTGAGGSKERVPLEAKNKLSHNNKGIVAMARGADPNSATSQFYITLAPQTSLDGKYAVFGKVIGGLDVVSKIEKDDQLYGIRMVDLSTVVRDAQPEKKNFFSSMF